MAFWSEAWPVPSGPLPVLTPPYWAIFLHHNNAHISDLVYSNRGEGTVKEQGLATLKIIYIYIFETCVTRFLNIFYEKKKKRSETHYDYFLSKGLQNNEV